MHNEENRVHEHDADHLDADPTSSGPDSGTGSGTGTEQGAARTSVTVRRHAGFAAVIGAAASAIAIAYLWRAVDGGGALDWLLFAVLAGIAGFYLAGLLDARTPLVVADELGVRIRLGDQWRGLPWDAVGAVEVHPRPGPLRDGRLVFRPQSLGRALDGLEPRGRRAAATNQKLYGAALAVPLGLTTRTTTSRATAHDAEVMADELAILARGRADVLVVVPEQAEPVEVTELAGPADRSGLAGPAGRTQHAEPAEPAEPEQSAQTLSAARPVPATEVTHDSAPVVTGGFGSLEDETDEGVDGEPATDPAIAANAPAARTPRTLLGDLSAVIARFTKQREVPVDEHVATEQAVDGDATGEQPADETLHDGSRNGATDRPGAGAAASSVAPLRAARPALRAQVTRDTPATTLGAAALHQQDERTGLPEGRELRRPGRVDLVFEPVGSSTVRPIAKLGDPVEPLVIDDFVTEPAYDPVIGPELSAARTRLGLSVDELADRTRIRPHVIESIEVDDFAPCGGDFYARGHLRTLARVLGQDPAPLLSKFDERYANAPINARRVFEAELATGMTGTMRSTVGGPNWGLLVGAVLSLVLVWGLVRLFATEPPQLVEDPAISLNGSGGVAAPAPKAPAQPAAKPLPIMLVAAQGATKVVVRDGSGKVVFSGRLVMGERKSLEVDPPVRVRAENAGAVEVRVKGKDRGPVGELGQPGRRTFDRAR